MGIYSTGMTLMGDPSEVAKVKPVQENPTFVAARELIGSGLVSTSIQLKGQLVGAEPVPPVTTATGNFCDLVLAGLRDYASYTRDPMRAIDDPRFGLKPEDVVQKALGKTSGNETSVHEQLQAAGMTVDDIEQLRVVMVGKSKPIIDAVRLIPSIAYVVSDESRLDQFGRGLVADPRGFMTAMGTALRIERDNRRSESEKRARGTQIPPEQILEDPSHLSITEDQYVGLIADFSDALSGSRLDRNNSARELFRFAPKPIGSL